MSVTPDAEFRPPATAEALLRRSLHKSGAASCILGDVQQEYAAMCRRGSRSAARRWYWMQVIAIGGRYVFARDVPTGGAAGTPGARPPHRGSGFLDGVLQDVRYALRSAAKAPGFTTTAVLTLALGVGATTAVFSVVNGVLMRPLPYPDADKLVVLGESHRELFSANWFVSPLNFKDWRERNRSFEGLAAWQRTTLALTGSDGAESIEALRVSAGFFDTMGVAPVLGRGFAEAEDQPGDDTVVVLSQGLWQRRFGADPAIIGTSITLDGVPHVVVGVAAETFAFTADVEIWAPIALDYESWPRDFRWLGVVGRLGANTTLEAAMADMDSVAAQLEEEFPQTNSGWRASSSGLKERMVRNVRPALLTLQVAVIFVLAIAAANVANLLLFRGTARSREIAIRQAVGASRPRLFRQLLVESVMLALGGAAAGLLLAVYGMDLLLRFVATDFPRLAEVGVDGTVFGFALLVSLVTGVAFGSIPAMQIPAMGGGGISDAGNRSVGSAGAARVRKGLIVAEVALTLVLLVGASLLISTLVNLLDIDPGFDPERVLAAEFELPEATYGESAAQIAFFGDLTERVTALPGVEAAGTISPMPLVGAVAPSPFVIDQRAMPEAGSGQETPFWFASPGYFTAMRLPLVRGRYLENSDVAEAAAVMLINQTFAERFFPGEDPIGRRFGFGRDPAAVPAWTTIVGVVGDVHHDALTREPGPQVYFSSLQSPFRFATLVVRGAGEPRGLVEPVRAAVQAVDPNLPISNLRTVEEIVAGSLADRRLSVILLGIFAGLALFLAAVGIFGVLSYSVTQRAPEVGVRMALGAGKASVMGLILRQGMPPVLLGVAIGSAAALALTRLLESQLYGVSGTDPLILMATAAVLVVVALAASVLPTRRATRIDPIVVLRND